MEGLMMDDFPLTLTPILERAERFFPAVRVATRYPDRSIRVTDYAHVARGARTLARALVEEGIRPGDRIATLMWNSANHLEAYLGIPAAGAVLHTLNLRLPPEQLAYAITHSGDRWIVVDDVLLPLFEKVRAQVRPERVFSVTFAGTDVPTGIESYEELLAKYSPLAELPERKERDAAALCYTSGTTGRLKGVLYSHRSIVLHSLAEAIGLSLRQSDCVLVVVPMFHANAWGLPYTLTMLGARQVLPGPQLDPESLLEAMEREKVTLAAGVPSIWAGLLESLEREPERWKLSPGLRMVVGGSAMPESMARRFAEHGIEVIHGYGMTETAPVVTLGVPKDGMQDWSDDRRFSLLARQGMALPLVEVRLRSGDTDVPWNGRSVGELQTRGPWVARTYFNEPEVADKWTEDGWLRTGDLATIDAEGYVEIVDRIKDLVKSGGEWISSVALENTLVGHAGVREAAVVARPDPRWGERPVAFVVLKDGARVTERELRARLAVRYPTWWLPDEFRFVEQLPKTSTGKVSKLTLREGLSAPSRTPKTP
jgi:fatty-acyl-CoA synthase